MGRKRTTPTTKTKAMLLTPGEPGGLRARINEFLEWLSVHNHTTDTVYSRSKVLGTFVVWCEERGLLRPQEITKPILERYQRWLFHYRKKNGHPLGVSTQYAMIVSIRRFFSWLARENFVLYNPASDLVLPRLGQRLPQAILSHAEVELVLNEPALKTPLGLRDRAILETLYSTGMRRRELVQLSVFDVDHGRGTVMIRLGKGQKDRVVPIGDRALAWIYKYVRDVRPGLVVEPDNGFLFLTNTGEQIPADWLSATTRHYIVKAGITKPGSCHLFRHTMATAMLEGGADVRSAARALAFGEPIGKWVQATGIAEAKKKDRKAKIDVADFTREFLITLTPLPCLRSMRSEERQSICLGMLEQVRAKYAHQTPMGPDAVMKQRREDAPKASKRSPEPKCHASSDELWLIQVRDHETLVDLYRRQSVKIRSGEIPPSARPANTHPPPTHWDPRRNTRSAPILDAHRAPAHA